MKRSPTTTPVTERLAALGEMIRLRICRLLEHEELSVGEVASIVQLPQSTVSRHLKLLSDGAWLVKRAERTATMYRFVLDDLSPEQRSLWLTVREQMGDGPELREDSRRLDAVLSSRQADTRAFFGRVVNEWDTIRSELFGAGFTAPALLALLDPSWTVADLGCGAGNAAALLAPHVRRVLAVDQSPEMLDAARARLSRFRNIEFIEASIESLPVPDRSLDAAVCELVLHHVEEPERALSAIRPKLRPGSPMLVIDMIEHEHLDYRHRLGHRHLGFSEHRAASMLETAGFDAPRVTQIPGRTDVRGPSLYVAAARAP